MKDSKHDNKNKYPKIIDCGITDFSCTLKQQQQYVSQRREHKIPDTVLILEHNPVITLGARQSANILMTDPCTLTQQGIDLIQIRRGGGITAHNPGQIVFYPILNLKALNLDITEYIRTLERIGIELLQGLSVNAAQKKGFPGLWVGTRKIASIGVRVSRQITFHGMAINIQNNLHIFDYFVPCGLNGVEMTSVKKETDQEYSMTDIKKQLTNIIKRHLSR